MSNNILANDLVFKNSFEISTSISGTLSGLTSSQLSLGLTLNSNNEIIIINSNGKFLFASDVYIGETWKVDITQLPSSPQQNCHINNNFGTIPQGGINNIEILCNNIPWTWDDMNWDDGGWDN